MHLTAVIFFAAVFLPQCSCLPLLRQIAKKGQEDWSGPAFSREL